MIRVRSFNALPPSVGRKRNGRRKYDAVAKLELTQATLIYPCISGHRPTFELMNRFCA